LISGLKYSAGDRLGSEKSCKFIKNVYDQRIQETLSALFLTGMLIIDKEKGE